MSNNKLRNVEQIQKLMSGTHRWQTRNKVFMNTDKAKEEADKKYNRMSKKIGEKWVEEDKFGKKIYYEKIGENTYKTDFLSPEIRESLDNKDHIYRNCTEECKSSDKIKTRVDLKMAKRSGRCLDCQVDYDQKLKYEKKFDEYARSFMLDRATGFFKDADEEVKELIEGLKKIEYVNAEGNVEKHEMNNVDQYIEKVKKDYEDLKKNTLESLTEKENKDGK